MSSFGSNKKTLKALNQSIEAQLQQVMTDKDRLLKRIHSNRATTRILGTKVGKFFSYFIFYIDKKNFFCPS